MSFMELVEKRSSVRKYSDRPVEKETILKVLEAARLAPSAVNYQPWHFIVVTDSELKTALDETYPRNWFKGAPVLIVACGDHQQSWKRQDGKDHCDVDVAIAMEHMALAACDLGLGSCWVCAFDSQRAHGLLQLPEHMEVVALLPMGYPRSEEVPEKNRKGLEEIVSWNGYTPLEK